MRIQKVYFDSSNQADIAAIVDNTTKADVFCPLINYSCSKECVCFVKAVSVISEGDQGGDEFYIVKGYCNNAMFTGHCDAM